MSPLLPFFPENVLGNELTKINAPKPANFKRKEEKVIMHIKTAFSQQNLSPSSNQEAEEIPCDLCCHSKNQIILSTNSVNRF